MISSRCANSSRRQLIVLPLCMLLLMIYLWTLYQSTSQCLNDAEKLQAPPEANHNVTALAAQWRGQRNQLSQMLNQMKQVYGQQSCEMLTLRGMDDQVSENGGWCKAASSPNSPSHVTDTQFSEAMSSFLKGKRVASFGDGPGEYKKLLESYGEVVSYTAYDGAPYCEEVTGGKVTFLDLTAPQYGLPIFDWGICVEVAEHIPAKYETIFLDNLVRHVREGLILSWSRPDQDGLSHVNNKAFEDVVPLMLRRGFALNVTAGEPLRRSAQQHWLKNNVHVYNRISKDSLSELDA
ncbi:unnamed protein product [Lymnaea stagnalis]|uniref:Methyltransferase type 11 domain-containing protein n=1 Tax=Lymnaea stagnalis TaxID=6523 RepID=A0AAV2IA53_LYMST